MFFRVMDKSRLPDLVRGLATEYEVVGPIAKNDAFVFGRIEDPADLRLEYTATILPPKKYFIPPAEELMRFSARDNEVTAADVDSQPRVIFGLHPRV